MFFQLEDAGADLGGERAARGERKIATQIAEGGGVAFEALVKEATQAGGFGRVGRYDQEQIDCHQRRLIVLPLQVDAQKIPEHTTENLEGPRWLQGLGQDALEIAARLPAAGFGEGAEAREQLVPAERAPARERVEDERPVRRVDAHEEMPREADPMSGQAESGRDAEQEHAERDRDTSAPIEDVVQEAIARVVVVVAVATKLQFLEKIPGDLERGLMGWQRLPDACPQGIGVGFDPRQVGSWVEVRVGDPRDLERGVVEIAPTPRGDKGCELFSGIRHGQDT